SGAWATRKRREYVGTPAHRDHAGYRLHLPPRGPRTARRLRRALRIVSGGCRSRAEGDQGGVQRNLCSAGHPGASWERDPWTMASTGTAAYVTKSGSSDRAPLRSRDVSRDAVADTHGAAALGPCGLPSRRGGGVGGGKMGSTAEFSS